MLKKVKGILLLCVKFLMMESEIRILPLKINPTINLTNQLRTFRFFKIESSCQTQIYSKC